MSTEGIYLLLLTISAFWSPLGGRYRQVSLYLILPGSPHWLVHCLIWAIILRNVINNSIMFMPANPLPSDVIYNVIAWIYLCNAPGLRSTCVLSRSKLKTNHFAFSWWWKYDKYCYDLIRYCGNTETIGFTRVRQIRDDLAFFISAGA